MSIHHYPTTRPLAQRSRRWWQPLWHLLLRLFFPPKPVPVGPPPPPPLPPVVTYRQDVPHPILVPARGTPSTFACTSSTPGAHGT